MNQISVKIHESNKCKKIIISIIEHKYKVSYVNI